MTFDPNYIIYQFSLFLHNYFFPKSLWCESNPSLSLVHRWFTSNNFLHFHCHKKMGPRTPLLQSIVFVGAPPITTPKRLGFSPEHGWGRSQNCPNPTWPLVEIQLSLKFLIMLSCSIVIHDFVWTCHKRYERKNTRKMNIVSSPLNRLSRVKVHKK